MKRIFFYVLASLLFTGCAGKEERLFKKIDSSYSGVAFSNDVQSGDTLNAFTFTNFYNGGGVGIADFNLDGWPDICFTANQKAPELYVGKGRLQFEKIAQTGLQNPGWATGISIVDINQDGWPDIYISMAQHPALKHTANQLYVNQQTPIPTFKEEAAKYGLAYEGFTVQTAFFDYDCDGDLDAFLLNTAPDLSNPNYLRPAVNNGTHPSTDKLFKNTGKQAGGAYRYEDASAEAGIRYEGLGLGVALADFNQDGWTDIYCSNDFQSDDALYLNNGDGTFRNVIKQAVKHTSMYGMGIDAADFNNDLHRDIFQLDMLPEDSERQKQMIARGDYEKKRLSVSPQYNYNLQYMRNTLQVNQGVSDSIPFFSEQGFLYNVAATDWSWSVLMADYDLDGWKDVFITNGYRKNVTDLDFISYNQYHNLFGDAKTQEENRKRLLQEIPEIKLRNYAFKNSPNQSFQDVSALWGLDEKSYSNGAAYADLDQDGDLDLVVNNIDAEAFVYENRSAGKNYIRIKFQGAEGNREGIGASVKVCTGGQCQIYDYFPVRGYQSSMNAPLVIGLGESALADRLEITWPGGKQQTMTSVKAGRQLTVDEQDAGLPALDEAPIPTIFAEKKGLLNYLHRESDFVDFHQTPTQQKMLTRNGPVIEQGDFNGDGLSDVVIGGAYRGSPTVVFYQQAGGTFTPGDTLPTEEMEVGALAVLDANGDGFADIFVAPGAAERPLRVTEAFQPLLFLGNGNGFTADLALPPMNICSESVLAGDFNGDGQTDLLLGGSYVPGAFPLTCPSILLVQEKGAFHQVEAPWLPADLAIRDMELLDIDRDGDSDIVLTGHWSGVTLLRNEGQTYAREDLNLPSGWWNCIKAADLDRDGDEDLILGNEGLNSIYRASKEQPVTLLANDFNGDDRMDPIWGLFLKDREAPIHPLGTLTEQMVQYKKRFTRFKEYAKADLRELFTNADLEKALTFHATELRSGIAFNDGNGNFRFAAFALSAQQSPVNDLLVEDFNGDNVSDLLLVGNFYPNEPIFGQSDASFGTLLLGQGGGTFEESPIVKSGLKIDGDVRKIIYLKREALILVTQNQGKVRTFSFQPEATVE